MSSALQWEKPILRLPSNVQCAVRRRLAVQVFLGRSSAEKQKAKMAKIGHFLCFRLRAAKKSSAAAGFPLASCVAECCGRRASATGCSRCRRRQLSRTGPAVHAGRTSDSTSVPLVQSVSRWPPLAGSAVLGDVAECSAHRRPRGLHQVPGRRISLSEVMFLSRSSPCKRC